MAVLDPFGVPRGPAVLKSAAAAAVKSIASPTKSLAANAYYGPVIAAASKALMTPAQQSAIANRQVNANIQSQLAASDASSKAEQQAYAAQQARSMGFANALASFGPAEMQQQGNVYNQAAQTLGTLGSGLTGAVADDWNQNLQNTQQAVAAQTGGLGQTGGYDPGALRSTAQLLGVTIPGTNLAEQAGIAANQAGAQARMNQGELYNVAQDYAQKALDALHARAADRAAIIARRPDLYQTALQAQHDDNQQTQQRLDTLVANQVSAGQTAEQLRQGRVQLQHGWTQTKEQLRQGRVSLQQAATGVKQAQQRIGQTQQQINEAARQGLYDRQRTSKVDQEAIRQFNLTHDTQVTQYGQDFGEKVREFNRNLNADAANRAIQKMAITHIDPDTKQPLFGYMWDPSAPKNAPRGISVDTYLANQQFYDNLKQRKIEAAQATKVDMKRIAQQAQNANKLGTYSEALSKQAKFLVDSSGHPFLDTKGNKIPYRAAASSGGGGSGKVGGLTAYERGQTWSDTVSKVDDLLTAKPTEFVQAPADYTGKTVNGYIPKPGTGAPAADYQTTMAAALASIPPSLQGNPAWVKRVRGYVDSKIPEGENGRPWSPKGARTAALAGMKAALRSGTPIYRAIPNGISHFPTMSPDVIRKAAADVYGPMGPSPTARSRALSRAPSGVRGPTSTPGPRGAVG